MSAVLTQYIAKLETWRKNLLRERGQQLNSKRRRDELREVVVEYFEVIRPQLVDESVQVAVVEPIDTALQELLALCHKRAIADKYEKLIADAKSSLVQLDVQLVAKVAPPDTVEPWDRIDTKILETLENLLPSAALSYRQALADLAEADRYSWRGPATDLREALRETLDYLAPDSEVTSMPWYKQNQTTNGPTMKQKVRYVLDNRGKSKANRQPVESATDAIDEAIGSFIRSVYTRSSVSTHTPTDRDEVVRVRDWVRTALSELLEVH